MSRDEVLASVEPSSEPPSFHPRAARQKLAYAQDYLAFLEFARRAKARLDDDTSALDHEIETARNMVANLSQKADARVDPRRTLPRPVHKGHLGPRPEYLLFLDECGSHVMNPEGDAFAVFCLCGVIVDGARYVTFDQSWRDWKTRWLGSPDARVHEPAVRTRSGLFHDAAPVRARSRIAALDAQIESFPFTCIAAAHMHCSGDRQAALHRDLRYWRGR